MQLFLLCMDKVHSWINLFFIIDHCYDEYSEEEEKKKERAKRSSLKLKQVFKISCFKFCDI